MPSTVVFATILALPSENLFKNSKGVKTIVHFVSTLPKGVVNKYIKSFVTFHLKIIKAI